MSNESAPVRAPSKLARYGIGSSLVGVGVLHFVSPKQFEAIIPEELPAKSFWVYCTGVLEVAGGAQLIRRPTRRLGFLLVGLLLLVFPANINMALRDLAVDGAPTIPKWALWARLPLQFVMIWAVLAATREPAAES